MNMEYFRKIVSLILFIVLLVNTAAAGDKISEDVKSRMQSGEKVPVIILLKDKPSLKSLSKENAIALLKSHASNSQKNIEALLKEEKGKGKADKIKGFWIVNAIALDASPGLIENLAIHDDVERIELDAEVHIVGDFSAQVSPGQIANATYEIQRINATKVWNETDGTGVNVSVIDTGINASHPDISGRVIKWVDFVNSNNASAYDDNGHGTHVAGTVGGNGSRGITTGVAPSVSIFGVKALDSAGSGSFSNVTSGIQWSVENNANVISMSIGTKSWSTTSGNCDSDFQLLADAINNSVALNVTVIAAAGNRDSLGVSAPGCISNTIAVGAVDSNDAIASFSAIGFSMKDHGVVAPGVTITSLDYTSSGYVSAGWSGTSMATPHVSGTVALLLQAARKNGTSLTPLQIRSILQNTSIDLGDAAGRDIIYGAGRINVSNATAAYAPTGQNTYVQSTNSSFSLLLKGRSRTINNSIILNNTGDLSAKVEARFSDSAGDVYGLLNGTNVLNATNFNLGLSGALMPLNITGANVQVAVVPPGVTALNAMLSVPFDQPSGDYSGTVILTFSNSI